MTFVRVRHANGYETSMSEGFAKANGLEVLDQPAMNPRGKPLPASRKNGRPIKQRTTVKKAAANKAAAATAKQAPTGGDAEQEE